jgi:hypothetical protein
MPITPNSARAYHGLQATAEPTSEGTSGTILIGQGQSSTTLAEVTRAIVLCVELDDTHTVVIDMTTLAATPTGAGVAQIETATAVGTITASGNATVTVTGDDIVGSPLAISVAVTNTDTAATWAGKVRTALNGTAAITSVYTVGGASTAISLTRTVARYNDATLNIALANGTCTGITAAPTSANSTAGVNPAKVFRIAGESYDGDDFEGADVPNATGVFGFLASHSAGTGICVITLTDGDFKDTISIGEKTQKHTSEATGLRSLSVSQNLTLTGAYAYSRLSLHLFFD